MRCMTIRWSNVPAAVTADHWISLWCDPPEQALNRYLLPLLCSSSLHSSPSPHISPSLPFQSLSSVSPVFPSLSASLSLFLFPVKAQTVTGILITALSSAQTGSYSLSHTHNKLLVQTLFTNMADSTLALLWRMSVKFLSDPITTLSFRKASGPVVFSSCYNSLWSSM